MRYIWIWEGGDPPPEALHSDIVYIRVLHTGCLTQNFVKEQWKYIPMQVHFSPIVTMVKKQI